MNPITAQFVFNSSESPNQFISNLIGTAYDPYVPYKGLFPAAKIDIDSSGSLYVFGPAGPNANNVYPYGVYKLSTQGELQWQRVLGTSSVSAEAPGCYGGIVDISGNPYICGDVYFTNASGNQGSIAGLAKYNSAGTLIFQYSIRDTTFTGGESPNMYFNALDVDSSNNIYAAGGHVIVTGYERRGILIKYNSVGTVQWQRALRGTNPPAGFTPEFNLFNVKTDTSGDVYVGGTNWNSSGGYLGALTKYNSAGTIQWQRSLLTSANGGSANNSVLALEVDAQRNVYGILRDPDLTNSTPNIFHIFKYDLNGTLLWKKKATVPIPSDGDPGIPPQLNFGGLKMVEDNNSVIVAGSFLYIKSIDSGRSTKGFIIKYSALNGDMEYQRFITNNLIEDALNYFDFKINSITASKSTNIINVLFAIYDIVSSVNVVSSVLGLRTNGGNLGSWTLPYKQGDGVTPAVLTISTGNITDVTGTFTSSTITYTGVTPTYTTGVLTLTTGSSSGTTGLVMI